MSIPGSVRMQFGTFVVGLGVLGGLLSGCATFGSRSVDGDAVVFEKYEIVTGSAKRQTVLTGFFLGGSVADLAVVNREENDDLRLRIYAFSDGGWWLKFDVPLDSEVLFVDVAHIDERDRLVTYSPGRLGWFDSESGREVELVRVDVEVHGTERGEVPRVDITRDVNGDGRDDLVVPNVDGFWISTQSSDGSFATPVKFGPPEPFLDKIAPEDTRPYGEVGITAMTIPWYLSRVHVVDYNQDGRSDLVFWNEDHFDVYHQNASGSFDTVAKPFGVDVHFDSDGVYSHIFEFSGESSLSLILGTRKRSKRTVLHTLGDVDGDGVADLVTHTLEGRSLLRQRSRLAVHCGRPAPGGIRFDREASTTIHPRGLAVSGYQTQEFRDLEGDGQMDLVHGRVDTGIGGMLRAMVCHSIAMDLEFYRIEDGVYPERPTAKRKIRPDVYFFDRRGPFFPPVLGGDVNGDGRLDLLVGQGWEELRIFVGVAGPDVFARHPQKVEVALPPNEKDARVVDINLDGKADILVHRPSQTEAHRVTMLISQQCSAQRD